MKRTYTKLNNKFAAKTLKQSHIEANRASDAFIATLLGWVSVDTDLGKEWVGNTPTGTLQYNCVGNCVVPRFTTDDSHMLAEHIIKYMMKNQHITITIDNSQHLTALIAEKKSDVTIVVQAPTLGLLFARVFFELKNKKLHKEN